MSQRPPERPRAGTACNRSWPHVWIEVWEKYFVALDFNRDDFLCIFFLGAQELEDSAGEVLFGGLRPCLVPHPKIFYSSHQIFGHMYETLNVDKK